MKRKLAAALLFVTLFTPLAFAEDGLNPNGKSCDQTMMQQIEGVWADIIASLFE